ncbi:hypothetical protein [Vibrio antiquarius]|nr:hypothetical protein [Vibrio antiquarius]MCR9967353.1 hypothetical protein [Vibrio antiquarius]
MDREIQQRLQWVKMYEECGDAGFVIKVFSQHTIAQFRSMLDKHS